MRIYRRRLRPLRNPRKLLDLLTYWIRSEFRPDPGTARGNRGSWQSPEGDGDRETLARPTLSSQRKSERKVKIISMGPKGLISSCTRHGPKKARTVVCPTASTATLRRLMRVLGLDLGSKRIGLAVSDPEASIAFPAGTLRSAGRKADIAAVCRLIEEREIGAVVVGLPRHMDGRHGPEAEAAEKFAAGLRRASGLPVETLDERWTSQEAERSLAAQGHSAKRTRAHVDEVAAAIILRTYLAMGRPPSSQEDG